MNRQSIPRLLEVGHRKVFYEEFGGRPEQYSKLFNIETSTRDRETDFSVGSMGLFEKRNEGADLAYDEVPKGYDNTYIHEEFALGYQVTRNQIDDDQYRTVNRFPELLGESARETIEREAISDFNNGFNSSYVGGDGVELFSLVHLLPGGGTGANELSTPADLTAASLEQALIDINSTVDGRGKQKVLLPTTLIVPKELDWTAQKILKTERAVGSDFNDVNPARGILMQEVNTYLTDPDAWFIQCSKHAMTWFWRRRVEFGRDNDFGTENMRFKGTFRCSHGWSDWMGMFGTAGA